MTQEELDKLAAKYGGTIDDLAAQYGGQVAPTAAELGAAQGGLTPQEAGAPPGGLGPLRVQDMVQSIPANVGSAVRGAVGGLASPVTAFADPVTVWMINPILKAMGIRDTLPPSQGLQVILDKLGVKHPETRSMEILQTSTEGLSAGAANTLIGETLKGVGGLSKGLKGELVGPNAGTFTLAPTQLAQRGQGAVAGVGESLAAQPAAQLTGGAMGGATSESARQMGASPAVQLGAGIVGSAVGGIAGNTEAVPRPMGPVDEAKNLKTWLMTSDVHTAKNPFQVMMQKVRESLGVGTVRYNQEQARVADVKDLVLNNGGYDSDAAITSTMKDLLAKRWKEKNKWTTAKQEVIDKVSPSESSVTTDQTAQERINDLATLEKNKLLTKPLQAELERLRSGSAFVPLPSTNKKIDDGIKYLEGLSPEIYAPEIKALTIWKDALQDQPFKNVETLRQEIGKTFKALHPEDRTNTPSVGDEVLAGIYGKMDANGIPIDGIRKDMTDYIKANAGQEDVNKWLVANKKLHDLIGETQLSALKTAINKGETTPELLGRLLFSKDKSTVEALYRNLTPEGQSYGRSAIIADAAKGEKGKFATPNEFADNMRMRGTQKEVFFPGKYLEAVDGLTRVLEYTRRAGEMKPGTGNMGFRATVMLPSAAYALSRVFGKGVEGFVGLAAAGGLATGGSLLFESTAVRAILSSLPKLKPGSKEEEAALKSLVVAAQQAMSKAKPAETPSSPTKPNQFGSTNYPGAPGMGLEASKPKPPLFPESIPSPNPLFNMQSGIR